MHAFTLDSFDAAPGLRDDLPTSEVGAEQLLVRVQASSVNPVDAFLASALRGMADYEFPVVLGRDYAGVVERAGREVTGYAPGDEVFGFLPHANPTVREGTWAELIVVPRARGAALTALAASDALGLGDGATLLVVGASGGVGSFAVQLAAGAGATVVASGLAEDNDYLRGLGAAEVVDRDGDVVAAVRQRHPDGVDALLDLASRSPDEGTPTRRWSATAGGSSPASARPARARGAATSARCPARRTWSGSPGCWRPAP